MTMVLEIPLSDEFMAFAASVVRPETLPLRVGSDGDRGVYRIVVSPDMLESYNIARANGDTASLSEFMARAFANGLEEREEIVEAVRRRKASDPLLLTVPRAEAELARALDDIEERGAADRVGGGSDFTRAMLAAAHDKADTWRTLLRVAKDDEARANGEPTEDPEAIKTALADVLAQHDAFQVRRERYKATGVWE